jgi:hypothetical protein
MAAISQPTAESTILSILVREKSSLGQHLSRLVKYVNIHHFPFFLWTITTFACHYGYLTSLINPASNSHCTSAFAASTFSFDILRSFCFLGFVCGLTCNLCLITSLLTPTTSEVDHAKNIIVLIKELQELCLLLQTHFSANIDSFIWYPGVECHSPEITFDLNCFF